MTVHAPMPPPPTTRTLEPASGRPTLSTWPTPVATAQPTRQATSNGTSSGTTTAMSFGTTISEAHVPLPTIALTGVPSPRRNRGSALPRSLVTQNHGTPRTQ